MNFSSIYESAPETATDMQEDNTEIIPEISFGNGDYSSPDRRYTCVIIGRPPSDHSSTTSSYHSSTFSNTTEPMTSATSAAPTTSIITSTTTNENQRIEASIKEVEKEKDAKAAVQDIFTQPLDCPGQFNYRDLFPLFQFFLTRWSN